MKVIAKISMLAELLHNRKLRYLIAGGSSFMIEYGLFVVLQIATRNIYFSNSLSFITGLILSFLLHKYWSFAGKHASKARNQFFAYLVLATINLALSNAIIGLLVGHLSISPFISKILTMGLIVVWNYYIFAKLIFRNKFSG